MAFTFTSIHMRIILLFIIIQFSYSLHSQSLVRKASLGIVPACYNDSVHIDSVMPNLTASLLGLRKHDVILSINQKKVSDRKSLSDALALLRTNDLVQINYFRYHKIKTIKGRAVMKPLEISGVCDITYDWVKFGSGYLRAMVRRPKNASNSPCILLIPGYGCGSIESFAQGYNGRLMDEWVRHGYAVVTIEKS